MERKGRMRPATEYQFSPCGHIPLEKPDGSNQEEVKRVIEFLGPEAGCFVSVTKQYQAGALQEVVK